MEDINYPFLNMNSTLFIFYHAELSIFFPLFLSLVVKYPNKTQKSKDKMPVLLGLRVRSEEMKTVLFRHLKN